MKKGEKIGKNTERKKNTLSLWQDVVIDFKRNLTPQKIAERYINPSTNRPYTVRHIYFILRQMNVI